MNDRDSLFIGHDADLERLCRQRWANEQGDGRIVCLERLPVMSPRVKHVLVVYPVLTGARFNIHGIKVSGESPFCQHVLTTVNCSRPW